MTPGLCDISKHLTIQFTENKRDGHAKKKTTPTHIEEKKKETKYLQSSSTAT